VNKQLLPVSPTLAPVIEIFLDKFTPDDFGLIRSLFITSLQTNIESTIDCAKKFGTDYLERCWSTLRSGGSFDYETLSMMKVVGNRCLGDFMSSAVIGGNLEAEDACTLLASEYNIHFISLIFVLADIYLPHDFSVQS
jgi:hypothetical protein